MWLHRPCRQSRNSSVECGRGFSFDMAPVVLSWPHRSNPCCVSGITEDPSSAPELCLFSYLSECELLDKTKVQIDSKVSNLWMCLCKEKKQDSCYVCSNLWNSIPCVDRNVCLYNVCIFEKELGIFLCSALCCRNRLLFILLFRATKCCLISFYYSYIFQTKRPSCCCGNHWPLSV